MRKFSGAHMRALRLHAGMRPEQLATLVARSASIVLDYERGRIVPTTEILPALADILGCRIDDLFEPDGTDAVAAPSRRAQPLGGRMP